MYTLCPLCGHYGIHNAHNAHKLTQCYICTHNRNISHTYWLHNVHNVHNLYTAATVIPCGRSDLAFYIKSTQYIHKTDFMCIMYHYVSLMEGPMHASLSVAWSKIIFYVPLHNSYIKGT